MEDFLDFQLCDFPVVSRLIDIFPAFDAPACNAIDACWTVGPADPPLHLKPRGAVALLGQHRKRLRDMRV